MRDSAASRPASGRNPGYLLGATPKRSAPPELAEGLSVSFPPGTSTDKQCGHMSYRPVGVLVISLAWGCAPSREVCRFAARRWMGRQELRTWLVHATPTPFSFVIPANAGIHSSSRVFWTPAYAGVTRGAKGCGGYDTGSRRTEPVRSHLKTVNVIASRSAALRLVSGRNPGYLLGGTPRRSLSVSFPPETDTDKQVCPCHPNAQFLRRSAASLPLRRQGKQSQFYGWEIASRSLP